jgi:hypothetical protein
MDFTSTNSNAIVRRNTFWSRTLKRVGNGGLGQLRSLFPCASDDGFTIYISGHAKLTAATTVPGLGQILISKWHCQFD